jgi:hypothetical protein
MYCAHPDKLAFYQPGPGHLAKRMCQFCADRLNVMGFDFRVDNRAAARVEEPKRSFLPEWRRRSLAKDLTGAL